MGTASRKKVEIKTVLRSISAEPARQTCRALVADYHQRARRFPDQSVAAGGSELLRFAGVAELDVYNICAPFTIDGRTILAGRIERRDTELACIGFFEQDADGNWVLLENVQMLHGLQDPCVTRIGGEIVLAGVRFPITRPDGSLTWAMEYYRGTSLHKLRHFFTGPLAMKDVRLIQLADGRVGILTRPQGDKGGRGKIGFCIVDRLEELTIALIDDAPLLDDMVIDDDWVGANEAHLLPDGTIGVLAHVARIDDRGHRHYYPLTFELNPITGKWSHLKVVAERALFPSAPAKRVDLANVVFSGGLIRHGNGTASLFAGLSDAAAGRLTIPDPFAREADLRNPLGFPERNVQ